MSDTDPILFYEREYYSFSNFSAFAVEWHGILWMTSEHAYQAAKFADETIIETIKNARSAYDAKRLAESFRDKIRMGWPEMKLTVMEDILRAKLAQHSYIQKKLMQTGEREIVEDSSDDGFWGWGPDKNGHNHLGKMWMKLRRELSA